MGDKKETVELLYRLEMTEKQLASLKEQLARVMDALQTVWALAEELFPEELAEYNSSHAKE